MNHTHYFEFVYSAMGILMVHCKMEKKIRVNNHFDTLYIEFILKR